MKSCDVLIVGGGPAGSTLAWRLESAGIDVLVADRAKFPRDKTCAGWITPAVVEALDLDLQDYRRGRVLQPIHGFRIGMVGGESTVTPPSDTPVSYGILRREFDHYLLERSGAPRILGQSVRDLRRVDGGWVVDDRVRARLLVGAGGHFCPVARLLNDRAGEQRRTVCAQEVEFALDPSQRADCPVDAAVPELFFCRDLAGYGWVLRKGDYLNVGLGREDPRGLSSHMAAFREFAMSRGRLPSETPRRFRGHAYHLYPRGRRTLIDDGVLLLGDSAGLAYAESGEGIRPAVESALIAADVILAVDGDYRKDRLSSYERRVYDRFGARPRTDVAAVGLPDGLKRFLAGQLLGMPWFVHHVVARRWFLRRHVPKLATSVGSSAVAREA